MRTKGLAVAALLALLLVTVPPANAAPEVDCTDVAYNATDPYEVWNAQQLQCMSPDGDYGLQSDINLSGVKFEPIPVWNRSLDNYTRDIEKFSGTLEGNGHNITGLSVHQPDEKYVGLFERIGSDASVTNLNLRGVNVTGRTHVGGLAGDVASGGEVSGVHVEGSVSGDSDVGGVAGRNGGKVTGVSARVKVSGNEAVGRLVGWNLGTVTTTNSTEGAVGDNLGTVSRTSSSPVPVPGFTATVAFVALLFVVSRQVRSG
jgi:hypothetical protein